MAAYRRMVALLLAAIHIGSPAPVAGVEGQEWRNRIDTYYREDDINGLMLAVKEFHDEYLYRVVTTCLRLGVREARADEREATRVWCPDQGPMVPLETELSIVRILKNDTIFAESLDLKSWSRYRSLATRFVVLAWKRLGQSMDADFDMARSPVLNVSPPIGTGLPSGVDPKAVQDPVARRQYEDAIADNTRLAEYYNRQLTLRRWEREFSEKAEAYLKDAYSRHPVAIDELQELLAQNEDMNAEVRDRIVRHVRERWNE